MKSSRSPTRRLATPAPAAHPVRRKRVDQFGYDAADSSKKRRRPSASQRSEDRELDTPKRRALISTQRDLHRNFVAAGWMIRKHLDFVSTFEFQARTGDEARNAELERLVAWWGQPENFDVAGRHSLQRSIRLAEERRTVDGDVFLLRLSDGRVQAIESDRVATPTLGGFPAGYKTDDFVHGVKATPDGRAEWFCICNRAAQGGMEFAKLVPARYVHQHAFYSRFDQLRGISPLAPAINTLRDLYEGIDYALAKMKVAQLFGLVFYRAESGEVIAAEPRDDDGDGEADRYPVDPTQGVFKLDLDPGDKAEFLESKNPSSEFQTFSRTMIGLSLKALDIPYSFYDESVTNYSGARQALLLYEQSADIKRADVRSMLDSLTAWRLGLFVQDGALSLPAGATVDGLMWDWVPRGLPWIDPLKEVNADLAAIGGALTSRTRRCRARGEDWTEIVGELKAEKAALDAAGLPSSVPGAAPEPEEPEAPAKEKDRE